MKIKLWGVRGSIPSPLTQAEYSRRLKEIVDRAIATGLTREGVDDFLTSLTPDLRYIYGGNTTCIEVQPRPGVHLIVDAGTGIVALGDELMKGPCGKGEGELYLFFTHTHWDHIQGLPFFKPLYVPGNRITFIATVPDLEDRLITQMQPLFFPMPFHQTLSQKKFHTLGQDSFSCEGLTITTFELRHPGGSTAYRFLENQKSFIFATDAEFTGTDIESRSPYDDFFSAADVLLMDAQYTLDDHFNKFDWGHTSQTMAVNCAVKWKVKNLILTHHEPSYPDDRLYQNYMAAIEHRQNLGVRDLNIYLGREGMQIALE
ncbi:MAG: MBL fold metallo-hydrolase [Spirochaetales bacterium]|nr:MBL fold metallo-hydrolase [Spirochaetales bacterium]